MAIGVDLGRLERACEGLPQDAPIDFFISLPFRWAPLCERAFMLHMPDSMCLDLPCLFACAIAPAFCSAVIPGACANSQGPVY